MAAVRSLRVSVKPDSGPDHSESDSDSDSDRGARESEPMEVEEGELEVENIPVNRSLKELLPDTSRRYENKAGTFITGIDVTSKEAIERKEKRAERFHFRAEANLAQKNVVLDRETMKKAIPNLRLEALHVAGVDDMSTQDVFGYFKEYPPAHIEWIDDTSCNVVWLDDVTSTRALINISRMPDPEGVTTETDRTKEPGDPTQESKARREQGSDDDDGEVDEEGKEMVKENEGKACEVDTEKKTEPETTQVDLLSQAESESLLRNDLRPAIKPFKGNKLFLRLATHGDKKELGAARKSRYYMKYGNPNYGGMRGILSNSWKRRYHTRRIVSKSKKPLIGDSMGDTSPYTHRHSADLVNLPEEPIEEEEEEDEEEEDMDSDDRVVEYKEKEKEKRERGGGPGVALRSRLGRPSSSPSVSSDSDEMDYDLELKMISTPSPKKSMKMTMYADEVETNLKTIRHSSVRSDSGLGGSGVRNRIGGGGGSGGSVGGTKSSAVEKVMDVRQLLEEKRQSLTQHRQRTPVASSGKTDVRQRLGKRPYSPERRHSASPVASRDSPPPREPITDVHSRLGMAKLDSRGLYSDSSKDRKSSRLWSRLGPSSHKGGVPERKPSSRRAGSGSASSRLGGREGEEENEEEDDSALQKVWGALIKQKEQQTHKMKKSRLDNLPSLQIEISRESSNGSDSDS
ncbi:nuclear cap-binding protein subunit 3 isoform X2 [Oncorhynchus mykiss]|uniref:Nuclear cap-binding protein subunit 3 n=1 Tax=Oncorhynchus mykiss TaxID=8022 RepID=A0A8K9XW10_ONCMY|nr:nuclear cap-binding protein subunit 3 isoform X2 [Oncorhynchus mykiss]